MNTQHQDIYERVTNQIVTAIEAGAGNYRMPWHVSADSTLPMNAASKRFYRGINVLALWATAQLKGYPSNVWATYKQWRELGAQVREGEKSSLVVFWKFPESNDRGASSQTRSRRRSRAGRAGAYLPAATSSLTPPRLTATRPRRSPSWTPLRESTPPTGSLRAFKPMSAWADLAPSTTSKATSS